MEIILKLFSFEANIVLYVASFLVTSVALSIAIRSVTRQAPRHHQTTLILLTIFLFTTNILIGSYIAAQLTRVPALVYTSPAPGGILDMRTPQITATFATPLNFKALRVYSYPETELTITPIGYLDNRIPFGRSITITPKTTYPGGEPILLFFSNIEGPLTHGFGGEHMLEFVASDLPTVDQIASTEPLAGVSPDTTFTATLTSPLLPSSQWHATTTPSHPVSVTAISDTSLTIHPDKPFTQGTTYTMTLHQIPSIYRYEDGEILQKLPARAEKVITFKTVNPPFVQTFTPIGTSVNPGSDISFVFDEPMDTVRMEKMITATPDFAKTFVWEQGEKILRIRHEVLSHDTTYVVILPKGIATAKGGTLETSAHFQFKTAGPVTLADSSPSHEASDISVQSKVQITFDQDVSGTIANLFTIQPSTPGKITSNKNIVTFAPDKPLAYSTHYVLQLAPGIQSVYGLPSAAPILVSFTTEPEQIALAVPYYKQQQAFTCNIAAVRMLLAFRGIMTDESTLISIIGSAGTRGNGNPYKGYVSDYGTYWDAVRRGVAPYRSSRLIINGKLTDVIAELVKGNPVMIWGQNGWSDPHDISWTATDGRYIYAINGMHSAVVRGFRGSQNNPTHILLNDPWRGQYTIPVNEFLRRWGYFSVALVVD